jgi:spoIIIJ-associated protein
MEWVETTGKDVAEAKEAALDILGVDDSEVDFEILEEGRSSFLGFGRRPARIRARLRPRFPAPKRERRARRVPKGKAGQVNRAASGKGGEVHVDNDPASNNAGVEAQSILPTQDEPPSRLELAALAQEFLAGLMQEFGLSGEVKVTQLDDDSMDLDIEGQNLGVLVGSRGIVLAAVQEVTRSVVQVHAGDRAGRVSVDIGGYKRKRKEALEAFVREQAQQVLETGAELAFEPMSPADRKIIHDVVASIEGVASRSEGDDPERFVVISRIESVVAEGRDPVANPSSDGEVARLD